MNYSGVICEKGWQEEVDKLIGEAHMSNESAQLELLNYYTEVVPCDETCGHQEEEHTVMNNIAEDKLMAIRDLAEEADKQSKIPPYVEDQVEILADFLRDVLDLLKVDKVVDATLRMGSHVETPNDGEIGTIVGLTDTEALVEYDNEGYDYFPLSKLKSLD